MPFLWRSDKILGIDQMLDGTLAGYARVLRDRSQAGDYHYLPRADVLAGERAFGDVYAVGGGR